jgi:pyridinium-3,5-biscarboxylic acid mononucleotide sulfurtransferase
VKELAEEDKMGKLLGILKDTGSLVVAFSGGVDSTLLLAAARKALGEKVLAVTAVSPVRPGNETEEARDIARALEVEHMLFPSEEMSLKGFVSNGPDRCYHCKKLLFRALKGIAKEKGLSLVAHGANRDDMEDYRPGSRAALEEGVVSPLVDAGLCKEEIRRLSREMGLPNWDSPASPCLATRIPYGTRITEERLKMIQEAEAFLHELGFRDLRVRSHGSVARIEMPGPEMDAVMDGNQRALIAQGLRRIGFEHVSLDLEGLISGKMNRGVDVKEEKQETGSE